MVPLQILYSYLYSLPSLFFSRFPLGLTRSVFFRTFSIPLSSPLLTTLLLVSHLTSSLFIKSFAHLILLERDAAKAVAKASGEDLAPDTSAPLDVEEYFKELNSKRFFGTLAGVNRQLDAMAIQLFKFFIACNNKCTESLHSAYPCKDITNAVKDLEQKLCRLCEGEPVRFTTTNGDIYQICYTPQAHDSSKPKKNKKKKKEPGCCKVGCTIGNMVSLIGIVLTALPKTAFQVATLVQGILTGSLNDLLCTPMLYPQCGPTTTRQLALALFVRFYNPLLKDNFHLCMFNPSNGNFERVSGSTASDWRAILSSLTLYVSNAKCVWVNYIRSRIFVSECSNTQLCSLCLLPPIKKGLGSRIGGALADRIVDGVRGTVSNAFNRGRGAVEDGLERVQDRVEAVGDDIDAGIHLVRELLAKNGAPGEMQEKLDNACKLIDGLQSHIEAQQQAKRWRFWNRNRGENDNNVVANEGVAQQQQQQHMAQQQTAQQQKWDSDQSTNEELGEAIQGTLGEIQGIGSVASDLLNAVPGVDSNMALQMIGTVLNDVRSLLIPIGSDELKIGAYICKKKSCKKERCSCEECAEALSNLFQGHCPEGEECGECAECAEAMGNLLPF